MSVTSMVQHGTCATSAREGMISGEIQAEDGVRLRYARWPAPEGAPCRGTVVVFQGRCEFIEKYFEVVEELRTLGFAVAMLDWRGQGGSQRLLPTPLKGHIESFGSYQRDVGALAQQVLPHCPQPFFALSHSMGGVILLKCVADRRIGFERMVLETPMLGLSAIPFQRLTRPLVSFLVRCGLGRRLPPGTLERPITELPFSLNLSTSDPQRYARITDMVRENPVLGLGPPTLGWVQAAFAAMDEIARPETVARLRSTPMLFISGGGDRLVNNQAIATFAARLENASYLNIEGARHEILTERDPYRAQFWAAFDAFMSPPAVS